METDLYQTIIIIADLNITFVCIRAIRRKDRISPIECTCNRWVWKKIELNPMNEAIVLHFSLQTHVHTLPDKSFRSLLKV